MACSLGNDLRLGTTDVMLEAYLARPKLRSHDHKKGVRAQFETHLKDWMQLPLDEISKTMAAERHRKLGTHPSNANHVFKYFRTVWNHARRTYDLPERAPIKALLRHPCSDFPT